MPQGSHQADRQWSSGGELVPIVNLAEHQERRRRAEVPPDDDELEQLPDQLPDGRVLTLSASENYLEHLPIAEARRTWSIEVAPDWPGAPAEFAYTVGLRRVSLCELRLAARRDPLELVDIPELAFLEARKLRVALRRLAADYFDWVYDRSRYDADAWDYFVAEPPARMRWLDPRDGAVNVEAVALRWPARWKRPAS